MKVRMMILSAACFALVMAAMPAYAGNSSLSLQPVIEGTTGVGVNVGITYLYLQADK